MGGSPSKSGSRQKKDSSSKPDKMESADIKGEASAPPEKESNFDGLEGAAAASVETLDASEANDEFPSESGDKFTSAGIDRFLLEGKFTAPQGCGRTASMPVARRAVPSFEISRAQSAPAAFRPLDAEDMRFHAVRGIAMEAFRRRTSSVASSSFSKVSSAEGLAVEPPPADPTSTVKIVQQLLNELPHRPGGQAALNHLETACKELGLEKGRRSSLLVIQHEHTEAIDESGEVSEDEEELSLEAMNQDMIEVC
mmetsp:Transcript_52051/g.106115  ORF Transcript_52051/g.106115 Transcript_52051/m.106115 type:complete len:254 (+) Transcript_52051:131-892(+)